MAVDPNRMGGLPCIRDLRVTVGMVLGQLAAGQTRVWRGSCVSPGHEVLLGTCFPYVSAFPLVSSLWSYGNSRRRSAQSAALTHRRS
ncbi:MAG: DUF433 domain-containing protein [Acidimicrobiales bacterium]